MSKERPNTGIVGFRGNANGADFKGLAELNPRCVDSAASSEGSDKGFDSSLGEPINVKQVAQLIGCSVWTIRQKFLHIGLPCLRSGSGSRLIFYRNQIVAWIHQQQKKGGQTK